MKSIKSGIVVVVMLVVVYGVWQVMNNKPIGPPQGVSDLMSRNFSDVHFGHEGEAFPPGPPEIQAPGFDATPGKSPGIGGGTMPSFQTPAVVPAGPEAESPYSPQPPETLDAHASGDHGHGSHANHEAFPAPPTSSRFASNTRVPAPVVEPESAPPIVGPEALNGSNNGSNSSAYGALSPEPQQQSGSVYSQGATEGGTADSGWGDHSAAGDALASTGFEMAWGKVQQQLQRGELSEALAELSIWYGSSDIPANRQQEMTELLDQLAGAVIYSPQHLLEEPYIVRSGETLQDVALAYQVPPLLLANINGLDENTPLTPGTELKVVRGPFNALISLERQELTLIVDSRYAGRFNIALGNDPQPKTGEFSVRQKELERTFVDRDGRTIKPGEDANPYGPYWIGLDGSLGIHGAAPPPRSGNRQSTGSIIVSPEDARDLFAILSEDSRVLIRR